MPYKDKAKQIAAAKRWKVRNREKYLAQAREYGLKHYYENREREIRRSLEWNKEHPKLVQKRSNIICARHRKELRDWYIRRLLTKSTDLKPADVPQELVELYKLKLIAERMLRNE